jgi:hypothetical protein
MNPGAEILYDIKADYHQALENHLRKGNRKSIKIFTDLAELIDIRVTEVRQGLLTILQVSGIA